MKTREELVKAVEEAEKAVEEAYKAERKVWFESINERFEEAERKAWCVAIKARFEADNAVEEAITQLAEFDRMWLEEHNLKLERSIFNEEA